MKDEILNIKPPENYQDNIIVYQEGLDNYPEYIDFIKAGYTDRETEKMLMLIRIETMKHVINQAKEHDNIEMDELKAALKEVQMMIEEYNDI